MFSIKLQNSHYLELVMNIYKVLRLEIEYYCIIIKQMQVQGEG